MTCFEEQVPMKNITDGNGAGAVRSATGLAVVHSQVGGGRDISSLGRALRPNLVPIFVI